MKRTLFVTLKVAIDTVDSTNVGLDVAYRARMAVEEKIYRKTEVVKFEMQEEKEEKA
jgi:hypothetical protein